MYSSLWPKLQQKAQTFANYSCLGCSVVYTPVAGTATNGTLWMGFTKNVAINDSDVMTSQEVNSLPIHASTAVSQPLEMVITTDAMNKGGKDLIVDSNTSGTKGTLSLFYMGTLFYTTTDVSEATTTIGTFKMRYTFRLTQPQANIMPAGAAATYDPSDESMLVYRPGEVGLRRVIKPAETVPHFRYTAMRPHLMLVRGVPGDMPILEYSTPAGDSTVVTPAHSLTEGLGGQTFDIYDIPHALPSWTWSIDGSSEAYLTFLKIPLSDPFFTWEFLPPPDSLVAKKKSSIAAAKTAAACTSSS